MPATWPELTLALALAILIAYIASALAARAAQVVLHALVADDQLVERFVSRPRKVVQAAIFFVTAVALAFPAMRLAGYDTSIGRDPSALIDWLLGSGLRIAIVATAGYLVLRIGAAATHQFERDVTRTPGGDVAERAKRARTLSQLVQKALLIIVVTVALLMVLRELQIDITPMLAGAGIVGLAVGFGAQTLIRDVITGFFLILEDRIRVGDVAVVNGQVGLIEQINLRTIVLRDDEGAVHVFPNGDIKTLANRTKDFAYYVIDLALAYAVDPDRAAAAVRDAGASLLDDPALGLHVLEPVEVVGIETFTGGHMTLRARIKTLPQKQWAVGRELRKRILRLMRERQIELK